MNKHNLVRSAVIAAIITIIFVVIITVAGELYTTPDAAGKSVKPIKDFLKELHGHHWVGKGIWAVILFIISTAGLYLAGRNAPGESKLTLVVSMLSWALILGTLALYGFFAYEYVISH